MELIESSHDLYPMKLKDPYYWEQCLEEVTDIGAFSLIRSKDESVVADLAVPKNSDLFLLSLRMKYPKHSETYCSLDVVTVDNFVAESGISWGPERDPAKLAEQVQGGRFNLGFLVRPVDPETVCGLALNGERVPPKTTFFDPKLPTGVGFRPLEAA